MDGQRQADIDHVLTPREREVLDLLRLGLTNAEIAERMEISLAGARYHVSEIITKLGVSSRYEAAAWPDRIPWWAGAIAPVAPFWRRAAAAMPLKLNAVATAASIGLVTIALGGIGLIGFFLLRGDDEQAAALSSPTSTPAVHGRLIQMRGRSMEPTLESGEAAFVDCAAYRSSSPQCGDVVLFTSPTAPSGSSEREFVKRVIAMPGETVKVRNGMVLIDGKPLEEPYIKEEPKYTLSPTTVPTGHIFVLGDNRNNSSDSHSWGPLSNEHIAGRVSFASVFPSASLPGASPFAPARRNAASRNVRA